MAGRTSPLPRPKAAVYLRKAQSCLRATEAALQDSNYDAAGLGGVHAVISACDALAVSRLEIRSSGQDHVELLRVLVDADVPPSVRSQVRDVLSMKHRAEYEARQLSRDEAQRIVMRARRVVGFVETAIPP